MLEDRDYMRQPEYHTPRVSWTVVLLIVNAVVFLAQLAGQHVSGGIEFQDQYFALSLEGIKHGYLWQLLTYQFMHGGWGHIIFNSLAIFFFGRSVETVLGARRFLGLYFVSGIMGGVLQIIYALIIHSDIPTVGASAGASGLIAAFAVINWRERFTLILYFIPVTMTGRTLLWISLGLAALGLLTPGSNIANAAHLGGIVTGFLYARQILHGNWPQGNWFQRRREERPRQPVAARASEKPFWRSAPVEEEVSADEFVQSKVDPILEKISAHGIQSLTAREREILESARKKMTRP